MLRRWILHPLEAFVIWLVYLLFAVLPVDAASATGGWIARKLGPLTAVQNTARRNLNRVLPDMTDAETDRILVQMWDNLGRTAGEHPHLAAFDPYRPNSRVTLVGEEHLTAMLEEGRSTLFIAGHFGNWELAPLAATARGGKINLVYRAANNPWVDRIFQYSRRVLKCELWPKGPTGAKQMLKAIRNGESIAMLVDQKMNDGVQVPFMGIDAMTAPAAADLALRYDCPMIPARVERLTGARFRVTIYEPIVKPETEDRHAASLEMMTAVNETLSEWIRERPEQWLWIHNRWPAE